MAVIPVKPLFMNDVVVTFGAAGTDDFAAAINQAVFTPSSSTVTFQGGKPDATFAASTNPTWVATLGYVQDWESTNSLSRYLHDHVGESVPIKVEPKAGGPAVDAVVSIVPGPIGGNVGAFATSSVSMGSTWPEIEDAA